MLQEPAKIVIPITEPRPTDKDVGDDYGITIDNDINFDVAVCATDIWGLRSIGYVNAGKKGKVLPTTSGKYTVYALKEFEAYKFIDIGTATATIWHHLYKEHVGYNGVVKVSSMTKPSKSEELDEQLKEPLKV